MVELKQNWRCISRKELIAKDHAAVSSGRPRYYYHKLRHQRPHHGDAASKSIKSKTVSLSADMHTMKEIILDPGLEMG
jgi:hypothetical protein